jgi:hypothetical protein
MVSKKRGAAHTYAEKRLMKQVADVFAQRKHHPGAKAAAKELDISLASFYKYANGTDLPRMEVLKAAQEKWGITWELLDPSEILKNRKLTSAKQLPLPLDCIRPEDVEIIRIGPKKSNVLRVTLSIRFST